MIRKQMLGVWVPQCREKGIEAEPKAVEETAESPGFDLDLDGAFEPETEVEETGAGEEDLGRHSANHVIVAVDHARHQDVSFDVDLCHTCGSSNTLANLFYLVALNQDVHAFPEFSIRAIKYTHILDEDA